MSTKSSLNFDHEKKALKKSHLEIKKGLRVERDEGEMSTEGVRRLQREYRLLHAEPPPFVTALPDPSDVFRWHFIVVGVPDSDYHGGEYFGTIIFPPNFPCVFLLVTCSLFLLYTDVYFFLKI